MSDGRRTVSMDASVRPCQLEPRLLGGNWQPNWDSDSFGSRLLASPTKNKFPIRASARLRQVCKSVPPLTELRGDEVRKNADTHLEHPEGSATGNNGEGSTAKICPCARFLRAAPMHGLSRIGSATHAALTLHRLGQKVLTFWHIPCSPSPTASVLRL
jgi:hypothetical protein